MFEESVVKINGVDIFCKNIGEGSPILLIHGAGVDSEFFDETANILAQNHKVISYDRRGYSRSGGEIEKGFLEESAEDAAKIISCFSPNEKVIVIGCSAGALIAMHLASRYPELVSHAIIHEPPTMVFLPEGHEAFAIADKIRSFVAAGKIGRGVTKFLLLMDDCDENARPQSEERMIREEKNMRYFIEKEFAETFTEEMPPMIPWEVKATFCAGDAHREAFLYKSTQLLAEKSGRSFIRIAGKHNCACDLPLAFAAAMEGILAVTKS